MPERVKSFSLLAATVATVAACSALPSAAAAAGKPTDSQVGTDAYVYGLPLMEFLRQARQQTSVTVPNSQSDAPVNQLGSARKLADASQQVIVQPNNDTLYTMGHLDLTGGPLVLHVPALPNHRYYSFEFLDPYTNVFAYVGTRTTGDGAGNYLITGPRFKGHVPAGMRRISSPYARAWAVGRTLVYGAADLPIVHRIQDGYRLIPLVQFLRHGLSWRPPRPHRIVTKHRSIKEPTGVAFFDALGDALAQNPPPARDAPLLRELATVGIGPGRHPSGEHLSAATLSALNAAVAAGPGDVTALRLTVATPSVLKNNGWFVPPPDIADYGTDYQLRGVVALFGIAANRPAEAMYIVGATDPTHAFLKGTNTYKVHFAAGHLPPARYFWSLTMYNQAFFLVANSINRYEIGNRSPGLRYNRDGSLDIYIQRTPPAGHQSNWLPSPSGQFQVTLRLYGPLPIALNRAYVYPPITPTG
jgi:hypothetical protein